MDKQTFLIKKEERNEAGTQPSFMVHNYPDCMNVKEELQEDMDVEYFEDQMALLGSTGYIKEDPELNLEPEETENSIDTCSELYSAEFDLLKIKEEQDVTSKRSSPDTIRLIKKISEADSMLWKETGGKQESVAGKSENFVRTGNPKQGYSPQRKTLCTKKNTTLKENQFHYFKCSSCKQSFSSKYKLIIHVFIHIDCVQAPEHICTWCGEVFSSHTNLRKHMQSRISHNENQYGRISNECHAPQSYDVIAADKRLKTFHVSNVSRSTADNFNPHRHKVPRKSLTQPALQKKRPTSYTNTKPFKCGVCYKSYPSYHRLKEHAITHTGERPHKCTECGKTFTARRILKQHEKIHTGIKPHYCVVCGKSFTRSDHLITHSLIHTGERPFKCNLCEKSFTNSSNLRKHLLLHSGKRPHTCNTCGKSFTEAGQLKIHTFIHIGKRPYKCEVCDKSFTQSCNLKTHLVVHTGKRSFRCCVCEKSFTTSGNLKNHSLIHSGEKPYKCDVCRKTFTFSSSLKSHALIHTGQRPHKCHVCGKNFIHSSDLRKHNLIHTGQKPYKCQVCGKLFTQSGNLKTHARKHTS